MMGQYWIDLALLAASVLVFLAFFMKAIVPLRAIAIASNFAFVIYAFGAWNVPILVLHAALLPLNMVRIIQYLRLSNQIRMAVTGDPHIELLLPLMERQHHSAGTVLFEKGDPGDKMYYLVKGRIRLPEFDREISSGTIFGEIAMFLNDHKRTASAVCAEDCEICVLSEDRVKELAMNDPAFGLFLTKLIAVRMNENVLAAEKAGP